MTFDPVSFFAARRALPPKLESFASGIVGDGVTDDSAAVKSALDAAFAAGQRYVWCEKTYNVPSLRRVQVFCIGPGTFIGSPYRRHVIPLNASTRTLQPRIYRRHLNTFLATSSPVVTIVGDSNAVERVAASSILTLGQASDNIAKSDLLASQIRRALLSQNRNKTITWKNRAIGGSAWVHSLTNTVGGKPPEWYSPTSANWNTFYEDSHLIIAHWGTNNSAANQAINNMFDWRAAMKSLPTNPDIIWSTPNGRTRQELTNSISTTGDVEFDVANSMERIAGAIRTIGEFYDDGVLDNHRQALITRDGIDVCQSTMERNLSLQGTTIATPYTFSQLATDYEVGLTHSSGTGALPSGGRGIELSLSSSTPFNVVRIRNVSGNFQVEVQWENGLIQPGHPITTSIPVPSGQMTLDVSVRNGFLGIEIQTLVGSTWVNTTLFYGRIVRYGGLFSPRIKMTDNTNVSFTLNWAAFSQPIMYMPAIADWQAWGWPYGITSMSQASRGGNSLNHPASDFYSQITQLVVERENWGSA